ncbi:hypothetical protein M427DRAFT_63832 [Gonapodya prolifera JEL478]|uniref:Uncharacterized protein n=1 Tax=Gonapodya prolifera (strain JEL478) TaxID=1344416 RepID=A0A138ZYR0_GONPJ|nr:hypothetical protein M427DRAFT_63832 [Gonapodya prolifera JEL478]|eukprot:KXS09644.1 hypothetical protein M427DRAFT_63832 [Gonapodya prolifera JEL478]
MAQSRAESVPAAPSLEFAFAIDAKVDPPTAIGGPTGTSALTFQRHFVPITGGTVTGPLLEGAVLPHSGDFLTKEYIEEADGRTSVVYSVHARYLIRANDGAVIEIDNKGFWVGTKEQDDSSAASDPKTYYFRTQPVFRTTAPAYQWLTRTIFVGTAEDHLDGYIRIKLYKVL